jgi:hypothetical protein
MHHWEWHKHAMQDLIVAMLMQAVRDADYMAKRKSPQAAVQHLEKWMDSMRFEFWVEWMDIPADVAEDVIAKIARGEIKPETLSCTGGPPRHG